MNEFEILLANTPGLGRVLLCSCNSICLSVGAVTLRLTPSAFAQTAALVCRALDELAKLYPFEENGAGNDVYAAPKGEHVN